MSEPELTQQLQGRFRERDVPILCALAPMHMHHHPFRIKVADMQIASFLKAKPQRIHRPEEDQHSLRGATVNHAMTLFDRQNFRQRFHVFDSHLRQRLPLAFAGASVKELDAAVGNSQ